SRARARARARGRSSSQRPPAGAAVRATVGPSVAGVFTREQARRIAFFEAGEPPGSMAGSPPAEDFAAAVAAACVARCIAPTRRGQLLLEPALEPVEHCVARRSDPRCLVVTAHSTSPVVLEPRLSPKGTRTCKRPRFPGPS